MAYRRARDASPGAGRTRRWTTAGVLRFMEPTGLSRRGHLRAVHAALFTDQYAAGRLRERAVRLAVHDPQAAWRSTGRRDFALERSGSHRDQAKRERCREPGQPPRRVELQQADPAGGRPHAVGGEHDAVDHIAGGRRGGVEAEDGHESDQRAQTTGGPPVQPPPATAGEADQQRGREDQLGEQQQTGTPPRKRSTPGLTALRPRDAGLGSPRARTRPARAR